MRESNKKIIFLLILLAVTEYLFASTSDSILMLVKFNLDRSFLSREVVLDESYLMSCKGKITDNYPEGYNIIGADLDSSGLEIAVAGPFNGDKRDNCKLYDHTTGNTNEVYFMVESLPIYFTYEGVQHSCYINQKIGTSYQKRIDSDYNKLQSEYSSVTLPCNGLVNTDTYKINPGHNYPFYYDKGNITINVLKPTQNILMNVKVNVPKPNLLPSIMLGESYSMDCAGKTTSYFPDGYSIVNGFPYTEDISKFAIQVQGPFTKDGRNTCTLHDYSTGNINDVYFSVKNIPIYFTYNNVKHSCYINQKIGTSYDETSDKNDKLQGQITNKPLSCNGLVSTDTYQINHGERTISGYDPGSIVINAN